MNNFLHIKLTLFLELWVPNSKGVQLVTYIL